MCLGESILCSCFTLKEIDFNFFKIYRNMIALITFFFFSNRSEIRSVPSQNIPLNLKGKSIHNTYECMLSSIAIFHYLVWTRNLIKAEKLLRLMGCMQEGFIDGAALQ